MYKKSIITISTTRMNAFAKYQVTARDFFLVLFAHGMHACVHREVEFQYQTALRIEVRVYQNINPIRHCKYLLYSNFKGITENEGN